jgi:hypothetical protein
MSVGDAKCEEKRGFWDVLLDILLIGLTIILAFALGLMIFGLLFGWITGILAEIFSVLIAQIISDILLLAYFFWLFSVLGWEFIRQISSVKPVSE